MSSLQKFHRRTLVVGGGAVTWPPSAIGGGDVTHGFWLGGATFNALIVAPKSTEVLREWGSYGTVRGTTDAANGLANTNTLAVFGDNIDTGHPAAYYAKTLTTGGYNTWYLPAKDELNTLYSNKAATPFATTNAFVPSGATLYNSSTESTYSKRWGQYFSNGLQLARPKGGGYVRPTRRVSLATTVGQGDEINGYWLGTAGDGVSKLIVAPKSTEVQRAWGSYGTTRGTTSTTDGALNTGTLYGFGSAAHPAAYYAKALTTGGYNTWYLPAKNELNTLYSNKSAVPFATANSFVGAGNYYWTSTEYNGAIAWFQNFTGGYQGAYYYTKNSGDFYVRAVRRV